jgi:hypothetical protein
LQNSPEQFRQRLQQGQFNEMRVALFLMQRGHYVRLGFDGGRYDISYFPATEANGSSGREKPNEPIKVEVKWDRRAGETGRLYFEVRNTRQNKPSGLASSNAGLWCQVIGEEGRKALMIPVVWLVGWVQAGGESGRFSKLRTGGKDSNSEGYLVPLKDLLAEPKAKQIVLPTPQEFFGGLGASPEAMLGHSAARQSS